MHIGFKRGQSPKESLEIGEYRKIVIPSARRINILPGVYEATFGYTRPVLIEISAGGFIGVISDFMNEGSFILLKAPTLRKADPLNWLLTYGITCIQKYNIEND